MSKFLRCSLCIASLLCMINAQAKSLPINQDAQIKVGLNASIDQSAYDQKSDVMILPHAFYDNNRVYILGPEAGVYAYKDAKNQWKVSLGLDGRSFDPKDAQRQALQGLDERQWSAMAGTSFLHITPYGALKAQVETDILGRSDGTTAKFSHISRFKLLDNKLTIYPEIGMQWVNDKYNNYYYGVSAAESARTGIAQYTPDSSVNPYANVSAIYDVNPRWSGFVSEHIEKLSDEQRNSPLVDNRVDTKTIVGFNYQF